MKVIFVLHSHSAGGAERHLLQLMQGLTSNGVECIYAGPLDGWLGKQVTATGIRCEHISFTGFFDLLSLIRLVRLAIREKADLIHGHLTRGAYYVGLASRLAGIPNVATAHSTNAGKWFGRADRIIAVADAVKRFLVERGYGNEIIRTVHNGVPDYAALPRFSRTVMQENLQLDDSPVLTMVARFLHAKGQDVALRALAKIVHLRWTLVLTGSLETLYAKQIQLLATELGLEKRIRFIGHRDDVINIYACTDVLLAPSRREAFSLTLLEAAAFSIPVVATDVGGISEAVVDGVTGILVQSEDEDALATAISTLVNSPELRAQMGIAGRKRYQEHFAVESMIRSTLAVYQEIVRNPI